MKRLSGRLMSPQRGMIACAIGLTIVVVRLAWQVPRQPGDLCRRASRSHPITRWRGDYRWIDEDTILYAEDPIFSPSRTVARLYSLDLASGRSTALPIRVPGLGFSTYSHATGDGKAFVSYEGDRQTGFREVTRTLDGASAFTRPIADHSTDRFGSLVNGQEVRFDMHEMKRHFRWNCWSVYQGQGLVSGIRPGKRVTTLDIGKPGAASARQLTVPIPGRGRWAMLGLSPDGQRIAWFVEEMLPQWRQWLTRTARTLPPPLQRLGDAPLSSLWITNLDGGHPQYLGCLNGQAIPSGDRAPDAFQWSPQGAQISFLYYGRIWTVAIPPITRQSS